MALVGKTERRDIPHEPGAWLEFRRLTGAELDEADAKGTERAMSFSTRLPAETVGRLMDRQQEADLTPEQQEERDFGGYDKDTLVRYGVVGWSYDEPCNDETKARLDAATRDWAALQVYRMNRRPEGEGSGSGEASSDGVSTASSSPASSPGPGASTPERYV